MVSRETAWSPWNYQARGPIWTGVGVSKIWRCFRQMEKAKDGLASLMWSARNRYQALPVVYRRHEPDLDSLGYLRFLQRAETHRMHITPDHRWQRWACGCRDPWNRDDCPEPTWELLP